MVDEDALLHAVRERRRHSAGLDVYEREPVGAALPPLATEEHVVTLPHIGSATHATRVAMVDLAVDNILVGQVAAAHLTIRKVRGGRRLPQHLVEYAAALGNAHPEPRDSSRRPSTGPRRGPTGG
ncbi:NAD(P)-dependent oxidoreductase [Streptomyces shenzhenensis]|uniref:NAD(P)-dependent oxidoreductase n=1 Tax=Streptomyces shenzhenensis TaxID=943815 RepID=UPI003695DADF